MNRQLKTTAILSLLLSFGVLPFQNCSNPVSFDRNIASLSSSNPDEDNLVTEPPVVIEVPDEPQQFIESFSSSVSTSKAPVDLIWVIDNSGSMREEAAHVRENLQSFLESTSNEADLNFKLISSKGNYQTRTQIPSDLLAYDNYSQINRWVNSHDSLGIVINELMGNNFTNFFRENTLKYFVFVTDDDSNIYGENFLESIKLQFPNSPIKVSGFLGQGSDKSPCQARTGLEYAYLASETGGFNFNICESDWSESFSKLSENIIFSANNVFELSKENIVSIDEVTVNGNLVPVENVEIDGKQITIQFDIHSFSDGETLDFQIKYTVAPTEAQ